MHIRKKSSISSSMSPIALPVFAVSAAHNSQFLPNPPSISPFHMLICLPSLFSSFLQCFYFPKCRKDYAATHLIVQNISEHLRSQHTVQCFVDPTDRIDSAILTQIYGRVAVFHSLFWPTCTLIVGTIIIAMVKLTQYLSSCASD